MAERAPGPITASASLLATLAEYRRLHAPLVDVDPRHAWLRALELPTELAPEQVAAVEQELGARLSDATLAALASRVPHLGDVYEVTLDGMIERTREAWAAGVDRDTIVLARAGDDLWLVPRDEHPWATTSVTPWHRVDGSAQPRGLERWLRDTAMDDLADMLVDLGVNTWDADDEPPHRFDRREAEHDLVPRLAVAQAAVEAAQVRVEHPKFGVGRVLRAAGAGEARKLDIDFGAAGVKTILARFVRELPPG
ncbi:MAG: hypothetical protein JNL82_10035 [Myxococcales bacterium]|nr:hypothetical protein [Myxococcales bacterium]